MGCGKERREGLWRLLLSAAGFGAVVWAMVLICGMPGCGAAQIGAFRDGSGSLLDRALATIWEATGLYERKIGEHSEMVDLSGIDYIIDTTGAVEADDGTLLWRDGDSTYQMKDGVFAQTVRDVEPPAWQLLAVHNVLTHFLLVIPGVLIAVLIFKYMPLPSRPVDRTRCARCGYDLTGLTQARCPECGLEFETANALEHRRGRFS